ncbi:MAG: mechanosensitive ion channel [Proteobacteria bacterium]|nr:mechanosensitive ion channel [Pseudomonadota bacterium]
MKAYPRLKRNLAGVRCNSMARRWRFASLCLIAMAVSLSSMLFAVELAYAALGPNLPVINNDNKNPTAGQTSTPSPVEIREELKRKLDEIQAHLDRLDGDGYDTKAPAGIKPEEVTEQRRLIESLIFFYQEGLNSLTATESEREKLKAVETKAREWAGFPDPPPYSLLMLYGLKDEAEALLGKQSVLESSLTGWQGDSASLQVGASAAQAALRLAGEAVERAGNPGEKALAVWRRGSAEWRVRHAERNIWFKGIQTGLVNARLAVVSAELALLDKKIKLAERHATLSEADLDKVREGLRASTRNFEQEQQKATSENTRWTKERDAASRSLEAAQAELGKGGTENPNPLPIEILKAQLHTADAWVAATSQKTETLGSLMVFNKHIEEFWNYQYTLLSSHDPKVRQDALKQLERDFVRLQQWGTYTQDNLSLAVSEERNQQATLDTVSIDSPLRRYEMQTLEAYRLKRQTAERIRLLADRTELMLARWLDDYRQGFGGKPFMERFNERLQDLTNGVAQLFRFELFTVDDEIELEGKKVNIARGVTLGKLMTALAVFVVGFGFVKWLSRRFQRMLVVRFEIDEIQSNVLKRWVLIGLSLILLVTVLIFTKIPLTAFAFLGGALAIGLGFGTQTMLKNLISGVMILIEHKIKVGDVVEVDNIVGTITEIDIRSSTVHGFDGVETMIPNSIFLEYKVTNWTYTNPNIRRSVRVGVAYGSPVREVIHLLLECANLHGQVLDNPKPFVWLEDFGENALVFGLYFWLELGPKVSSLQVMSDLRCMIIEALGKAGIAIPFPQRDIHFNPAQTLLASVVGDEAKIPEVQPGPIAKG